MGRTAKLLCLLLLVSPMKHHIGVCPKLVPSEKKEGLTGWVFLLFDFDQQRSRDMISPE
jgi:hypothetical protein